MAAFEKAAGVKVNDANPNGTSAEELQAIRSLKGQARAPDVIDVGPSFEVTATEQKLLAPYKVATWDSIPDQMKHPDGFWYGDYFGIISFGVNAAVAKKAPRSWSDLKRPDYKGMVALGGSPLASASAFASVYAAALGNGGSLDDIEPGVRFFGELAQRGNLSPAAATPASLISGQTPIYVNWDYLSLAYFGAVAANFAGVPLAFAFIATLGTLGLLTAWLDRLGVDLYDLGFSLFSLSGLTLVSPTSKCC